MSSSQPTLPNHALVYPSYPTCHLSSNLTLTYLYVTFTFTYSYSCCNWYLDENQERTKRKLRSDVDEFWSFLMSQLKDLEQESSGDDTRMRVSRLTSLQTDVTDYYRQAHPSTSLSASPRNHSPKGGSPTNTLPHRFVLGTSFFQKFSVLAICASKGFRCPVILYSP